MALYRAGQNCKRIRIKDYDFKEVEVNIHKKLIVIHNSNFYGRFNEFENLIIEQFGNLPDIVIKNINTKKIIEYENNYVYAFTVYEYDNKPKLFEKRK